MEDRNIGGGKWGLRGYETSVLVIPATVKASSIQLLTRLLGTRHISVPSPCPRAVFPMTLLSSGKCFHSHHAYN